MLVHKHWNRFSQTCSMDFFWRCISGIKICSTQRVEKSCTSLWNEKLSCTTWNKSMQGKELIVRSLSKMYTHANIMNMIAGMMKISVQAMNRSMLICWSWSLSINLRMNCKESGPITCRYCTCILNHLQLTHWKLYVSYFLKTI